jgi:nitrite reductase/ring-hydroxylating ferredoxin subunit
VPSQARPHRRKPWLSGEKNRISRPRPGYPIEVDGMFTRVCKEDTIFEGGMRMEIVDAHLIILAWPENGAVKAFQGVCPHADTPLAEAEFDGTVLTCPLRFWTWNIGSADPRARRRAGRISSQARRRRRLYRYRGRPAGIRVAVMALRQRRYARSIAARLRSAREQELNAPSCVARRTTRGAWPASKASCQRGAHRHHRSPGFRPGKP